MYRYSQRFVDTLGVYLHPWGSGDALRVYHYFQGFGALMRQMLVSGPRVVSVVRFISLTFFTTFFYYLPGVVIYGMSLDHCNTELKGNDVFTDSAEKPEVTLQVESGTFPRRVRDGSIGNLISFRCRN